MFSRLAVAGLAAALAACGPLPRPFQPDDKPLWAGPLKLADGAGVIVEAGGCSPPDLGPAVAAALRARDVPADTGGGNPASLRLVCAAADGALTWTLRDSAGTRLGRFAQAPAAAEQAAAEAAREVVAIVAPDRAPPAPGLPPLVVPPVAGAPGDGGAALTRAMARALSGGGAPLAADAGDGTLLVLGSVAVSDAAADAQHVEVVWEVIDVEGRRLGVVSQANTVPRGRLDGAWGDIAAAIAAGGADAVLDLVARANGR